MKTAIISILAIAIIIGGYIFIKDQKIKAELSNVEESKVVESNATTTTQVADSQITLNRVDGEWAVTTTGDFTIDPSSIKFEFTGYKPGGQHVGTFNTMNAIVSLDEAGNPILSKITIDPTTVKTDSEAVDKHLQAPEFFDTATNPNVTVVVKEIQKDGNNVKAITDLTIKGVTKTLAIPVTVTNQADGVKFDVDTRIKISDFKMAYGPVQDEVRIALSGVLKKN